MAAGHYGRIGAIVQARAALVLSHVTARALTHFRSTMVGDVPALHRKVMPVTEPVPCTATGEPGAHGARARKHVTEDELAECGCVMIRPQLLMATPAMATHSS